MEQIIIKNLWKSYDSLTVLKNVDLTLDRDQTYCLMSPSGTGKTTLFRILMGLEKADEGEKKQALSVSLDAEPDSLDLAKVSDMYSTTVVSQMIEGLTAIRVDENGAETVEPGMAESWESSEDQMTWTFHLRDAKWEDGVDVKAGDFEYAIKRILNPETASPISGNILFIKNAEEAVAGSVGIDEVGVKALDDKTLEIQLAYPAPYF